MLFVKKEKKSKSKNTAELDQRKKKKKKKRKLESSVDGEHKKAHKKKKKEHKAEAITVKNETNVDEVKNHDPEGLKLEIEDMKAQDTPADSSVSSVTVKDDVPLSELTPKAGSENDSPSGTPTGVSASQNDDSLKTEEENEDYKWWEDEKFGQGPERWLELEHNGVLFPPPYEPLPSYVETIL
ncbi:hypothetical protein HF325_004981 [Metschnikowia pulcherrima]|uniref:Uncharacterized protein n=1 Tax=Metschnikowia pulcherrima TaxID=27326 RepID=A0A8H7GRG1_9ASCO|nr:hypothetical protein HF325_004981 [Metschnikowia pulcherrima]